MAISTSLILKFNGSQVAKGLALVKRSFVGLGQAGANAGKMMLAPFAKLMAVLAPLVGFAAIGKIGADSLKAASDMETLQTQFAALLKSESKAADLIAKLRKLNVESPLGVEDFAKGAKQLLGVQFSAQEATDALDKLSNISMGKSDSFESLVRAFGQVRSAGRLMGQEVLQFVNAGFNPLTQISLKTGESMSDLKKRMEDGKISFQEVAEAIRFATAEGGLFNGMNQKVAATTEGKIQKLKDSWSQLLIAFGTPINDALKPLIDKLTDKFSTLTEKVSSMGRVAGEAITTAFNAFKNEDLGNLIKSAFMVGVTKAGEYLIGIMGYIGNELMNKVKEAIKLIRENDSLLKTGRFIKSSAKMAFGDINAFDEPKPSKNDPLRKYEMSPMQAINAAEGILKSGKFQRSLSLVTSRNSSELPPGYRFAKEDEGSMYSDANGAKIVKLLEDVNRNLSPTP